MDILNLFQNFIKQVLSENADYCANVTSFNYRESIYKPKVNGVYEKKLATALLDVALNTTAANCLKIGEVLPNPPGFLFQQKIEGLDPSNGKKTMFAYIFYDYILQHAVISFTGTSNAAEWLDDLNFNQVPANSLIGYTDGMVCHEGFYKIYLSVRDKIRQWWAQNNTSIKTLYITGHSLGGALSTICALDMRSGISSNIEIIHYSFAAPRCGNNEFANTFNKVVNTSLRINNTEDAVPQLPPASFQGYNYTQTTGNINFTLNLNSLRANHIDAYLKL